MRVPIEAKLIRTNCGKYQLQAESVTIIVARVSSSLAFPLLYLHPGSERYVSVAHPFKFLSAEVLLLPEFTQIPTTHRKCLDFPAELRIVGPGEVNAKR